MKRLADLNATVETWRGLEGRVGELRELVELASAEEDAGLAEDLEREVADLALRLDQLELELSFAGPYDARDAILAIHAGAGGTESQDWAEMLLRMYLRWAERRGYQAQILDMTPGEEAGL